MNRTFFKSWLRDVFYFSIHIFHIRKRTVNQEMAEMFAASVNAKHIHTSAKNNEGIDNLFETLTNSILVKHCKPDTAPARLCNN